MSRLTDDIREKLQESCSIFLQRIGSVAQETSDIISRNDKDPKNWEQGIEYAYNQTGDAAAELVNETYDYLDELDRRKKMTIKTWIVGGVLCLAGFCSGVYADSKWHLADKAASYFATKTEKPKLAYGIDIQYKVNGNWQADKPAEDQIAEAKLVFRKEYLGETDDLEIMVENGTFVEKLVNLLERSERQDVLSGKLPEGCTVNYVRYV